MARLHRTRRYAWHGALIGSLLTLSVAASAQDTPPPARRPALTPEQEAERDASYKLPNPPGSGPFAAIQEMDPSLPNFTVYRPANLAATGRLKLGVMIWGNGGCRDDGATEPHHLLEVASHGYVVIAPGRILTGPNAVGQRVERKPDASGKLPPPATTSEDLRHALDWILRENTRSASRYHARIDPRQIAVAGHSCGGLQALQMASDKRVRTVLIHNSGVFKSGAQEIATLTVDKALLKGLHTPVVYFLGGPTDIAYPNGTDDFARIDHVPVVMVNMPVGHSGTFFKPNGGAVAQASVDWLQWHLRGDRTAARSFVGPACRLCVVPGWSVERKKI